MTKIEKGSIITKFGNLDYYQVKNDTELTILFIHGLGTSKDWFLEQYEPYTLSTYSWIVPDLLGHGHSSVAEELSAYTMDNQANYLFSLLTEENVDNLVIMGHSMGGPIAISLIEKIIKQAESPIKIKGLLYMEGNLDENDTTFSSKVAEKSVEEFSEEYEQYIQLYPSDFQVILRKNGAFPIWASCVGLVDVSKETVLLPRLKKVLTFPVFFIFGENNKGLYSSETLVRKANLPVDYIPDAGHGLHEENPKDFWRIIKHLIAENIK